MSMMTDERLAEIEVTMGEHDAAMRALASAVPELLDEIARLRADD